MSVWCTVLGTSDRRKLHAGHYFGTKMDDRSHVKNCSVESRRDITSYPLFNSTFPGCYQMESWNNMHIHGVKFLQLLSPSDGFIGLEVG